MSAPIPEHWDHEYDVVVVGGGNAGLPAALTAHDAGAETVIVEQNEFLGGLHARLGRLHVLLQDPRAGARRHRGPRGVGRRGRDADERVPRRLPEIVEAYVAGGADTVQWLEDLGLTWSDDVRDGKFGIGRNGDRSVARTHFAAGLPTGIYPGGEPEGQNGYALTSVLEKAVADQGVPVLYRHRMRRIFREPGGRVVGIEAETPDGTVTIRARRGVVLASGGATTNEGFVKAWDARFVNDAIYSDGLPVRLTAMGDAFIAYQEVGAGLSDMSLRLLPAHPLRESLVQPLAVGDRRRGERREGAGRADHRPPGRLPARGLLRAAGHRYIDESIAARENPDLVRDVAGLPSAEYPEEPFIRTFLELPNPKNVWAVTDAVNAEAMKWPVDQIRDPDPMHGRGLHPDSVATADTLEALAKLMGMDPAIVATTMERYNRGALNGHDEEFGKTDYPALTEGPFYAVKMNLIRHTPSGGIRINAKGQVLDQSGMWDRQEGTTPRSGAGDRGALRLGEAAAFVGFRRAHRKTGPILTMGRITGRAAAGAPPA